jgi:hypothetical protein
VETKAQQDVLRFDSCTSQVKPDGVGSSVADLELDGERVAGLGKLALPFLPGFPFGEFASAFIEDPHNCVGNRFVAPLKDDLHKPLVHGESRPWFLPIGVTH